MTQPVLVLRWRAPGLVGSDTPIAAIIGPPGDKGDPGEPGEPPPDPGDLTLIFDNHLI